MSDKWTTYFARGGKVYIEPPQHLDKKYDDLLLGITGNLTHEYRMKAAKELCELFNTQAARMVELVMALEEELDVRISDEDCENWKKAGDIQEHFESLS